MAEDLEIGAFSAIVEAMEKLDDDARWRVLEWARQRFGKGLSAERPDPTGQPRAMSLASAPAADTEFGAFVDLFDAANPRIEAERALLGGYWQQAVQGANDFQGQQVNDLLKDLGHGISNITDALAQLQRRKPALVRQVAKSGKTRQARKRYKLTSSGIAAVHAMVRDRNQEDGE